MRMIPWLRRQTVEDEPVIARLIRSMVSVLNEDIREAESSGLSVRLGIGRQKDSESLGVQVEVYKGPEECSSPTPE